MRNYLFLILFLFLLAGPSCKKFVEVPAPDDRILAEDVFASDEKALGAMTAVYGNAINGGLGLLNGLGTVSGGYSADELLKYNALPVEQEFSANSLLPTNANVKMLWSTAYQNIYYVNAILEGIQGAEGLSAPVKAQLEGESRFVRALHYFYLVNYFGRVPLVTSTDYAANSLLPRVDTATIYQQIVTDLLRAKELLPAVYATADRNRPNKWAASALLARAYLYQQNWAGAISESDSVIGSSLYGLQADLATVFLKNSREAIWQLSPTSGLLRETSMMRPTGTTTLTPQIHVTQSVLSSFEAGDRRRQKWVDSVTFQSVRYYYPSKYRNTSSAVTEYYTVLRLAEVYLIRAEARLRSGNLPGAIQDINAIRSRAGLSGTSAATESAIAAAISLERQHEFFAEFGHRWLDLKRWGTAGPVLAPIKAAWQPTDIYYPIPQDELLNNSALHQNPGY
ncbi:MAG: RagB/SusD family nutrient uptake outer membrane protein [Sphingobacteriales bacterium]|nr:MAG: RagB/SusD family nutrient uptake outer membrane protein [Sphingobacteriales bacterium]